MYPNRIARVRASMTQRGLEAVILTPSTDLFYLVGAREEMMERLTCLLLTQRDVHFIAPAFELSGLSQESRQVMACHGWTDPADPFALIKKLLPGITKAAVGRHTPGWVLLRFLALYPDCDWLNADEVITPLRMIKDEYEYKMLAQVQHKAGRALARLMGTGLAGRTEREVSLLLRDFCAGEGVENNGAVVASGPNSAFPHHSPTDRVIRGGDVVTIDFGGIEPEIGYHNDTTRTFCVGYMPEGFQEVYELVNRANQAAFEAVRVDVPCQEIDRAARRVITEAGYGKYFVHRAGHGLGLDLHEPPYMAEGSTTPIQAGNVFSDEPGIYIPGKWGVRIEDQIFVHPLGPERLTPMEPPLDHALKIVD